MPAKVAPVQPRLRRRFAVELSRRPAFPPLISNHAEGATESAITITRCIDNEFNNARMTAAGYEIIAIETWSWPDGWSETEIVWAKDGPIDERELPH